MSECDIRDSFHYAVAKGYLAIVDRLLKHKLNVSLTSDDRNKALYCACSSGNLQMAIRLLAAGADPCVLSQNGETPLYAAIHSQNVEIVRALIEAEPDVIAARDLQGATPLHVAAERGYEDIVKEILQVIKLVKKLDLYPSIIEVEIIEALNMDGETALYVATQAGRSEVVHMLLNEKANVCIRNKYGRSVIDWAVTKTRADVVRRILDAGVIVDRAYMNHATLLHRAALNGTPDVIKLLLERTTDINSRGIEGMTALHWAACSNNPENLKQLLDVGITIKERASGPRFCEGFTALHFAATLGVPESVIRLLEAGADIDSKCCRGGTALLHAIKAARNDQLTSKVVALLLNSGAALNVQDFEGNTGLHYCAGDERNLPKPLTMKILLNFGIDPSKRNTAGKTAVDAASDYGDQHTLMILREVNLVKVLFSIGLIDTGMHGMLRTTSPGTICSDNSLGWT
jgi:ankyrin repeat protein